MKILHTGDLHIGMTNYSKLDPETGLESRLLDFFKTFDFIIETAIKEGIDAFIFAGDAYKTRDPSPTQQRGFGERVKKIAKAGIPVVMVVGNHDTPNAEGRANTLDIYSALEIDNVWVSRHPEFLSIPTKSGHLEVEGASFGSEKGLAIVNDVTVPLSLLTERKLNYVALGHIHKYQELSKNPPVIYAGSPERIDFGEEKEEKGFVLVELSAVSHQLSARFETSYRFIPTPARKFLTIKIMLQSDDENPTDTILKEIKKHEVKDKIVRVTIDIPAELNHDISMDQIKKALADANLVAGISRNVERKERVKLDRKSTRL